MWVLSIALDAGGFRCEATVNIPKSHHIGWIWLWFRHVSPRNTIACSSEGSQSSGAQCKCYKGLIHRAGLLVPSLPHQPTIARTCAGSFLVWPNATVRHQEKGHKSLGPGEWLQLQRNWPDQERVPSTTYSSPQLEDLSHPSRAHALQRPGTQTHPPGKLLAAFNVSKAGQTMWYCDILCDHMYPHCWNPHVWCCTLAWWKTPGNLKATRDERKVELSEGRWDFFSWLARLLPYYVILL